ncbi:hypothetical protein NDU88_012646 [Pleurodeles waltl]|uniref:Uncharacterized protein n=1 Tax=Pleurodeles waltl TaxID=8319 RepID=A0AAV7R0N5_PLEWA|nr:hypothetical protein NDU88_012646 [Pleurodeles waltl]
MHLLTDTKNVSERRCERRQWRLIPGRPALHGHHLLSALRRTIHQSGLAGSRSMIYELGHVLEAAGSVSLSDKKTGINSADERECTHPLPISWPW